MFDFSQWQSIWIQAVAKSWNDDAFRKALLADSRAAIKAFLGEDLPGDFPVRVVEVKGREYVLEFVLGIPERPSKTSEEADRLAEYATSIMTDAAFICAC